MTDRLMIGSRMIAAAWSWLARALALGDSVGRLARWGSGQRVGVLADLAAVALQELRAELGMPYFVPGLAGHRHDQFPRHGPGLPFADLPAEGVDAGVFGADDAAHEGLAELDVPRSLRDHLAQEAQVVVRGIAKLLRQLRLFCVIDEDGGAVRRIAPRWRSSDLFGESDGHSERTPKPLRLPRSIAAKGGRRKPFPNRTSED